jgi:hypothetical protein
LQLLALLISTTGVVIALLVWAPWTTGGPVPNAAVKLAPNDHNALVPLPASRLPAPPAYPREHARDHCADWATWFDAVGAASEWPNIVEVSAPVTADVAVVDARIQVFRSYIPTGLVQVECLHGAGPIPGTLLMINLSHPNRPATIVADDGSDIRLHLPDAVINIAPGHTEYIALRPSGTPRMFEWSASLRVVVAQHSRTITIGSRTHPLRTWLGHTPQALYDHRPSGGAWSASH